MPASLHDSALNAVVDGDTLVLALNQAFAKIASDMVVWAIRAP